MAPPSLVPPSNHFEKLRGKLAKFHSIRVSKQWRLVFQWDGSRGEASDLYLDNHSYDLWEAMHSPRERERIERARPLTPAA